MKNLLVAITGGIGSGKSTALCFLQEKGYPVISCDEISRELYKKHAVKREIKKLFPFAVKGKVFLKIDRKALSSALNDDKSYNLLCSYTTPLILEMALKRAKKFTGTVFIEVPLLFECNAINRFDKIVVITRDKNSRIHSAMKRSNITEQEVLARLTRQVDYDNLDLQNYTVISNDGKILDLQNKLLEFIKTL